MESVSQSMVTISAPSIKAAKNLNVLFGGDLTIRRSNFSY
jgi:hypothetical protein